METKKTVLSFEEFIEQGKTGDDSIHGQIGMTHDDVPATDAGEIGHDMMADQPEPAVEPVATDSDNTMPVHMMDDETGEAETTAEPNVQIEEPKDSGVK